MVLALIGDVIQHPGKMGFPKAQDAIAALPFKDLSTVLLINFMRGEALQHLHHVADCDKWLDSHRDMNMIISAADTLQIHSLDGLRFATYGSVAKGLDFAS